MKLRSDRAHWLIVLLFISATFSSCKDQQRKTEVKEPLPSSISTEELIFRLERRIWVIHQDTKGNYWFGSNGNGITWYDGSELKFITTKDGLNDNTIRGIQEDHLGNIFIETPGGVSKYDGKEFTTLEPIVPESNQWQLASDDLWFNCNGNADDVYRYDGENLYQLQLPRQDLEGDLGLNISGLSYSPYTVFGIDKDKQGNIWFGTVIAGAYRYDGESFLWVGEKELSRLPDGREPGVRSMLEDNDGYIWLSNFMSKYKINDEGPIEYEKSPAVPLSSKPLDDIAYFNSGLIDVNGDLWMTEYGGDVWKYDGDQLVNFPVKNGEMDILLISIYEDRESTLWLGTDNDGAYRYNGESFEKFIPALLPQPNPVDQ